MNTFLGTVRFARPYLARYWPRFVIGIVLGMLFGVSNGLFLGSIAIIAPRITSPTEAVASVAKSRAAQETSSSLREEKANEPDNSQAQTAKVKGPNFKQRLILFLDPWLPIRGQPMDWKRWTGGLLLLPLIFLLRGVLGYFSSYCLAWSGQRITNDVKTDAFRKISQQSLDYFQKTPTAEIMKRIDSDSVSINNFLRMGLNDLVKEPTTIACCLAAMLFLNWKFTLIALIYTPFCIIPTRIVARRIKDLGRRDFATGIKQGSVTIESFHNIRITKAYGLEEVHTAEFRKNAERSAYYNIKSVQSREMLNPAVQVLAAFSISLVLLYAMWTNCDSGTLTTFIASLFVMGASVKKLNTIGVFYTQLSLALERLLQLFALQPSVKEIANPAPLGDFTRALEFRDVSFSYGDAPVLQDVSFTLERGQRLGLAGESGSGKSSLINLLFRFYDPTQGAVLIDGTPINQLRLADLRYHMALVSQDILLFNGTVAENIGFGKIGATREEVITAAKEAYADKFILELPQGYDTHLGERGQRLSGGQRQRIAIARAFVRNAPILVLDEATAALDAQSEAEVQKAIDHLAEHRTVICVAHRLSTLRAMDRILVLSQGRVVEQGTFDQLLFQRGIFTAMAARQSIFPKAA
jgi:ABC-type multidrug transport system fused ATPase/permease subunit